MSHSYLWYKATDAAQITYQGMVTQDENYSDIFHQCIYSQVKAYFRYFTSKCWHCHCFD